MREDTAAFITFLLVSTTLIGLVPTGSAQPLAGPVLPNLDPCLPGGTEGAESCDDIEKMLCEDFLDESGAPGTDGTEECTEDLVDIFEETVTDCADPDNAGEPVCIVQAITDCLEVTVDPKELAAVAACSLPPVLQEPAGRCLVEFSEASAAPLAILGDAPLLNLASCLVLGYVNAVAACFPLTEYTGPINTGGGIGALVAFFTEQLPEQQTLVDPSGPGPGDGSREMEFITAVTECDLASIVLGGSLIDNEQMFTDNSQNPAFAKQSDTITLTFDTTGPAQGAQVTFSLEGTPFATVAATDTSGTGESWSAQATAPSGDGTITATVNVKDDEGEDLGDQEAAAQVTLDNTAPVATISFEGESNGVVDSTGNPAVDYVVDITDVNLDTTSSSVEATAPDGVSTQETDLVEGENSFFIQPTGLAGTIAVEATLYDRAGNMAVFVDDVLYQPPPVTASIASTNAKTSSVAIEGDEVVLTITTPGTWSVESLEVTFAFGGDLASGTVAVEGPAGTGPFTYTASVTVAAEDSDGDVTFLATFPAINGQTTVSGTVDGTAVTIDMTAPALSLVFPQQTSDGSIGVGPGEDIEILLVAPSDFDADSTPDGTITCEPATGSCSDVTVDFSSLTESAETDDDGNTVFSVTVPHFGEGTVGFESFSPEDLAGNTDAQSFLSKSVVILDQRVTATLTEGDQDANDDIRYVGDGDSRTYAVTITHKTLTAEAKSVGVIVVDFSGDGTADSTVTSVSHPNALIFVDNDGNLQTIEIELDDPLEDDSLSFTYTVKSDMTTGQELVADLSVRDTSFQALGNVLATTTLVADTTGPTIASHDYLLDANDDGTIDYDEFQASGDGIVLLLSGIMDNVGGSGAKSVEVGFDDDGNFVVLGTASLETDSVEVTLDHTLLSPGPLTVVARAVDSIGNVGGDHAAGVTIAIEQRIIVTPAADIHIAPNKAKSLSFTISPEDVVQNIARYDLRTPVGDYALQGYSDSSNSNVAVGLTGNGEVRLVRYTSPDKSQALEANAVIVGHGDAAHGETSEFMLTVLNTAGKSDVFTVVDTQGEVFVAPVFRVIVDALPPDVDFVQIQEQAEDGAYNAEPDSTLTFEFTVSEEGSGLDMIVLEVHDPDTDTWSPVAGQSIDLEASTIQIDRPGGGDYTYRIVASDIAGNEGFTEDIEVTVLNTGDASVSIESISQSSSLEQNGDGTYMASADQPSLGELDDSDVLTVVAKVVSGTAGVEGATVTLSFETFALEAVTTTGGEVMWMLDPDDYGIDFAVTTMTVEVADQEVDIGGQTTVLSGDSSQFEVVFTGFYIDLAGDDAVNIRAGADLQAEVYFLHDVIDPQTGVVSTDGAPAADGFSDARVVLSESIGGQSLELGETASLEGSLGDVQPAFVVTRGPESALLPAIAQDANAGFRKFTPQLVGDLPWGLQDVTAAQDHTVLYSGVRLIFDTLQPVAVEGDDVSGEVHAEWLHTQSFEGVAIDVRDLSGRDDIDVTATVGSPVFEGTLSAETNSLEFGYPIPSEGTAFTMSGVWDEPFGVYMVIAGTYGVSVELSAPPSEAVVADYMGSFTVGLEDVETDGTSALSLGDLVVSYAGMDPQFTPFVGATFGPEAFSVLKDAVPVTVSPEFAYDGAWTFGIESPAVGVYDLNMEFVLGTVGGVPVIAQASQQFGVTEQVYEITLTDVLEATDTSDLEEVWFRSADATATLEFRVDIVESDGVNSQDIGDADESVSVEVWTSDDGATWTKSVEAFSLSASGTGSVELSNTFQDGIGVLGVRIVVVEDDMDTYPAVDGLNDVTNEAEADLIFTELVVAFDTSGDEQVLAGETISLELSVTYAHNGWPAEGVDLRVTAGGTTGLESLPTTDASGAATASFNSADPIRYNTVSAEVLSPAHGLAVPGATLRSGALSWVELKVECLGFETSSDGGSYTTIVDCDDNLGSGDPDGAFEAVKGKFIRVTARIVIDDGTETTAASSGSVLFGAQSASIGAGGEAKRTYFSSTANTVSFDIDITSATALGETYGPLEDAEEVVLTWTES